MKKTSIYFSGLLLAFLLLGFQPALNAQVIMHCDSAYPTKIRSILDTPGQYNNEKVTVVGIVRNFIPGNSTSLAYYIIEGKFGDTIRVKCDSDGFTDSSGSYVDHFILSSSNDRFAIPL